MEWVQSITSFQNKKANQVLYIYIYIHVLINFKNHLHLRIDFKGSLIFFCYIRLYLNNLHSNFNITVFFFSFFFFVLLWKLSVAGSNVTSQPQSQYVQDAQPEAFLSWLAVARHFITCVSILFFFFFSFLSLVQMWLKKQKQTFFTQSQVCGVSSTAVICSIGVSDLEFLFFFSKHTCICLHVFLTWVQT